MVRLLALGGKRRRGRDGAGSLRASHCQCAARAGEEALEALHLPMDQLCPLRGAGGEGAESSPGMGGGGLLPLCLGPAGAAGN